MGKKTIAEFVESDGILARLRAFGVDYAQGWFLDRPAPLAERRPGNAKRGGPAMARGRG